MLFDRARINAARAWRLYQREGVRAVLARAAQEVPWELPSLPRSGTQLPLGVHERRPRSILASVESPARGEFATSDPLVVSGWAVSRARVEGIDCYLDGQAVSHVAVGADRPDIDGLYPKLPGAGSSGYIAEIALEGIPPGSHDLLVVIRDADGNTRVLARTFQWIDKESLYDLYYARMLPTRDQVAKLRGHVGSRAHPTIDLVIEARAGSDLASTLRSVFEQKSAEYTCTILADPDDQPLILEQLARFGRRGDRARVRMAGEAGLFMGHLGDRVVGVLRAGETLAPYALALFAIEASDRTVDLVYSDHDVVELEGRHVKPCFGPDWAPDHLLSQDYIDGFFLVRARGDVTRLVEACRTSDLSWRYDLLLQLTDKPTKVAHIPRVLWSSPARTGPEIGRRIGRRARRGAARARAAGHSGRRPGRRHPGGAANSGGRLPTSQRYRSSSRPLASWNT